MSLVTSKWPYFIFVSFVEGTQCRSNESPPNLYLMSLHRWDGSWNNQWDMIKDELEGLPSEYASTAKSSSFWGCLKPKKAWCHLGSEPGVMQQETPHAFGTRYWLSAQICCCANWKYCKEYKNWAKAALGQSQSVITAHVYLTLSTHSRHGRGYCFSVSWVSDVIDILRYQGACC